MLSTCWAAASAERDMGPETKCDRLYDWMVRFVLLRCMISTSAANGK